MEMQSSTSIDNQYSDQIQLNVTEQNSTLLAQALGDAVSALNSEGRSYYHSNFQPTGRYASRGTVLTVTVSPSVIGLEIVIGQYGVYAHLNDGNAISPRVIALNAGVNRIVAPVDGMVYIQNRISDSAAQVEINGGQPIPTYIKGVTNSIEFYRQLIAWKTAPFIELVGEYVLANFQFAMATQALYSTPTDLDRRIAMMDDVLAQTNALYGLSRNATGAAHKSSHRIYITNPDTGAGYASATDHRITFQNSTGAGKDLLVGPEDDQWGLYHEVGHTYQMREFRWSGLGEVTVNISALAVQEAMGYRNRLDTPAIRSALQAFRATPIAQRSYDGISDLFLKVLMFDQLRRGFGPHFYAQLAQTFRLENALGIPEPEGELAVQQHFMITAASVTDRNLTPFFEEWGMPINPATRTELARFPTLKAALWNNIDRPTDVIERKLDPLKIPGTLLAPADGVSFDKNHIPTYRGTGTPGATVTIEQGTIGGAWSKVGTTTVNTSGRWSFSGQRLSAGEREARATQSNGGTGFARNRFTVTEGIEVPPVVLLSPAGGTTFDTNHRPIYSGTGKPGTIVGIQQGTVSGTWEHVANAVVDTNGDWSLMGQALAAGEREARALQSSDDSVSQRNAFTVKEAVAIPVTLTSPAVGASFDINYRPTYRGRGTPGVTVTIEQGAIYGAWYKVGTTTVNTSGDWSFIGQALPVGEREARALQSSDDSVSQSNAFTVTQRVVIPVSLTLPAEGDEFDTHHTPTYSGRGMPGETVTIQQGAIKGGWYNVGEAVVNTNGDWSFIGQVLSADKREARAIQSSDESVSQRHTFTVTEAVTIPVTLTSPAEGALFDINHRPTYRGKGSPGATITLEQGTLSGAWHEIGETLVNSRGDWCYKGRSLAADKREVRATQSDGGTGLVINRFTVAQEVKIPVTLTTPAAGSSYNTNQMPTYSGRGTPGATVTIEQGLIGGAWNDVGEALVDTNGNWFFTGRKLSAGEREARASQSSDGSLSQRNTFTVIEAAEM